MEAQKAKQLLQRQIEASENLGGVDSSSPTFQKWKRDTGVVIERIFGNTGRHIQDFETIHFSLSISYPGMPDSAWVEACQSGLEKARAILQSMLEEVEDFGLEKSEREVQGPKQSPNPLPHKLIFVSHSSGDKDLADALLDMLCTALHLRLSDFVCTSVDGAKLKGGDDTDEMLRAAIREVPAFLSILTRQAVGSTYVLFELGARWGCAKHHIPLLAKGGGAELLKEPLKATNALRLSEESDVLQLVQDLAPVLGRTPEPPNSFLKKARKVVELSSVGAITGTRPSRSSKPKRKAKATAPTTDSKPAERDPNRVDADAERVLTELASQGNIVTDPLDDPDAFCMHRVRLERCVVILEQAGLLKESETNFGGRLYIITGKGKQYLFDHGLV